MINLHLLRALAASLSALDLVPSLLPAIISKQYATLDRCETHLSQEYLAIGEAPDQIRNCYQQRSRWCKGHFQIIFNKQHCPLTQSKLSVRALIIYSSIINLTYVFVYLYSIDLQRQ